MAEAESSASSGISSCTTNNFSGQTSAELTEPPALFDHSDYVRVLAQSLAHSASVRRSSRNELDRATGFAQRVGH